MTQSAPFESLAETIHPRHTALLVIDVQNDLCGANCQAMLPRLKSLIRATREAGAFVIYVQNSTVADHTSISPSEIARRRNEDVGEVLTSPALKSERLRRRGGGMGRIAVIGHIPMQALE